MTNKFCLMPVFLVGAIFTFRAMSMNMGMKNGDGLQECDTQKYTYLVERKGDKILASAYLDGLTNKIAILVTKDLNLANKNSRNDCYTRECFCGGITLGRLGDELDKLTDKIVEFEKAELKKDKVREKKEEPGKEDKEKEHDLEKE